MCCANALFFDFQKNGLQAEVIHAKERKYLVTHSLLCAHVTPTQFVFFVLFFLLEHKSLMKYSIFHHCIMTGTLLYAWAANYNWLSKNDQRWVFIHSDLVRFPPIQKHHNPLYQHALGKRLDWKVAAVVCCAHIHIQIPTCWWRTARRTCRLHKAPCCKVTVLPHTASVQVSAFIKPNTHCALMSNKLLVTSMVRLRYSNTVTH